MTGSLIRLAECLGLHREPTTYSSSPIEIHVRRLVWYQICFLDLRTCEAIGPRPQIRPDDYDTQFPLNIDDIDLDRFENGEANVDVRTDRPHFTDMTITRMRFECYEMHRFLWNERPKSERKKPNGGREVTITSLLSRVQSFKAAMEKTYLPMLSTSVPLHVLASEMYGILSNRLYILLLQKYLSSDRTKMPDRLQRVIVSAATMILEHSMMIEQHPALSMWAWYIGALHQYHGALLLLNELYTGPHEPAMEQRIWKCLDFSFELPSEMSNIEKTRQILEGLISKMNIYADKKRVRAPNHMPQPGPRMHTPGYKARQREAQSEMDDNGDLQPAELGSTASTSSQQIRQPHHHQLQRPQNQASVSFPGAMPLVDWGTIDMPTPILDFQQTPSSHGAYSFGKFTPTTSAEGVIPTDTAMSAAQHQGYGIDAPDPLMFGSTTQEPIGGSPMDALADIDWVCTKTLWRDIH